MTANACGTITFVEHTHTHWLPIDKLQNQARVVATNEQQLQNMFVANTQNKMCQMLRYEPLLPRLPLFIVYIYLFIDFIIVFFFYLS